MSKETQTLLAAQADSRKLRRALAEDLNHILEWPSLYTPERFKDIPLPPLIEKAAQTEQLTNTTVRLNRRMLEAAYPQAIVKSLGGVYPDTEIRTASLEDLQDCERDYEMDAQKRLLHDREHPNEPRQIKPGEDVSVDDQGRIRFGGGVLMVMGINSYVTKVMFDANTNHEFYVEESYPMDWMYSYLTPFGVIMKVNRQPLDLSDEIIERDHLFWSQYSDRLVGNWITYDTTARELCDFVEKVYLRHNYEGFKGDPKFIRDDDAQKGFSKLRSAIGASIYQWRAENSDVAKNPAVRKRLMKEAEFAFKQAFAYCPYSEGAYKYAELLADTGRPQDAVMVSRTFQKLDPHNKQVQNMVVQLYLQASQRDEALKAAKEFLKLEPDNSFLQDVTNQLEQGQKGMTLQDIFNQVATAMKAGQNDRAAALLDQVLHIKQANGPVLTQVAQLYAQMGNLAKAEEAMHRATEVDPGSSQSWYNLANIEAFEGRAADAAESLRRAFATNAVERAADSRMIDLRTNVLTNPNFNGIRQSPEFRAVIGTN